MLVIQVVTWVHVEIDPRITVTLMVRIYTGINRVIVYLAGQSQRTKVLTDRKVLLRAPERSRGKLFKENFNLLAGELPLVGAVWASSGVNV